jgi:hypothetical protein
MANAIEVSDSLSNANEQIESVAKAIGRSKVRRQVFEAIYHHKSPVKTVETIHQRTGLSRMRVLQAGRHLALKGAVKQVKKDGDTAYQKIDFVHIISRKSSAMLLAPLNSRSYQRSAEAWLCCQGT